jgi:hypothetical protein
MNANNTQNDAAWGSSPVRSAAWGSSPVSSAAWGS